MLSLTSPDGQTGVHAEFLARGQLYSFLGKSFEAIGFHDQTVRAGH